MSLNVIRNHHFSILTVTKNNQHGLQKTAESLKGQTSRDFEWIVADGGSTDETLNYMSEICKPHLILHGPDQGIFDGMNKVLSASSGAYILFLNAGDILADPETLEHLQSLARDKNPDFIHGDSFEHDGATIRYKKARPHTQACLGMFTHHQACLYKGEIVRTMRFNLLYKIAADYEFTLKFLKRAQSITYTPKPLCVFEAGGLSQQLRKQGRQEQFIIRQSLQTCSGVQNNLICAGQYLNAALRDLMPAFYWRLKRRG
jgi:putative colanic acid biosynthesis glycosyltransferase